MGVAGSAVEGESSIWVTFIPDDLEVGTVRSRAGPGGAADHRGYFAITGSPSPLANPRRLLFHAFPAPERTFTPSDGYPPEPPALMQ